MRKLGLKILYLTLASFSFLVSIWSLSSVAEEVTGREFTQLIQELNNDLANARKKVKELEAEREAKSTSIKLQSVLPERKEELRKLNELTQRLADSKSPQQKAELEQAVQKQITRVAEVSADFIEETKNDLLFRDRQLQVMEDALAGVILKLDRLVRLTQTSKSSNPQTKEANLQARRELQNLARLVEHFAQQDPGSENWNHVRQTILLQNAVLTQNTAGNQKIAKLLQQQKQMYEQAHTQIVLTRRQIAEQRSLLAQIALGEVARSMLRKAANLLLGELSIADFGLNALNSTEAIQKSLLEFLNQEDDSIDIAHSAGDRSRSQRGSQSLPPGYAEFLSSKIE